MKREQLEHIVRAAADVTKDEPLVVGSQSILGSFAENELPPEAVRSIEADLAFFDDPDGAKADQIDGAIGEGSHFHETFGVYAQGVSTTTAVAPEGWRERLVALPSGVGWCLDRHDIVLSKMVRGEPRDHAYAASMLAAGLLDVTVLESRIELLPVGAHERARIRGWLSGQLARRRQSPRPA